MKNAILWGALQSPDPPRKCHVVHSVHLVKFIVFYFFSSVATDMGR